MAANANAEEDDWLVGYLVKTSVGKDPKLNAATQKEVERKKAKKAAKLKARLEAGGAVDAGAAGGHVTSILGIKRGMARRSSWAAPTSAAAKEISSQAHAAAMAAVAAQAPPPPPVSSSSPAVPPPSASAGGGTFSIAAAKAASAGGSSLPKAGTGSAPSAPAVDPAAAHAGTKLAMLQAGRVYHRSTLEAAVAAKEAAASGDGSVPATDNFANWAASSSAAPSNRRISSSGGGLRPAGAGPRGPNNPNQRRMSTSRISMSGRRQSMDYSELDAVKQR